MAIWNERIKQKRLEKGITLAQVAEALNVTEATAQRYESGSIKSVPYEHMCTYAKLFNCSPQYLMGWDDDIDDSILDYFENTLSEILSAIEVLGYQVETFYKNDKILIKDKTGSIIKSTTEGDLVGSYEKIRLDNICQAVSKIISPESNYLKNSNYLYADFLEKYRALDPSGQEHVNTVLDWESARVQQLTDLQSRPAALVEFQKDTCIRMAIYTHMQKIACAGNGFYFDDIPTETIKAPYMDGADFIIGVSGDSMEPTYHDGDLVYVQKRQIVEIGDIGIFMVNNECCIKEAGEEGLISHNKKYPMIPGDESIQCIGKVLGKVNEQ